MNSTLNVTIMDMQQIDAKVYRYYIQYFIGLCIGFLFSCSAIVANVIVLVIILKKKHQRTPFDLVIASLSITDFSASICAIIFIAYDIAISFFISNDFKKHGRQSNMAFDAGTIFLVLSIMHILLVTFLRFFAVFWPIKFRQLTTKTPIKVLIGAIWTISLIAGIVIIRSKYRSLVSGIIFLTSVALVCCAYVMIALKIFILSKTIQSATKKEYRALLNSFGVTITFFGCMLPLAFVLMRVKAFQNIDIHLALSFITINFFADPLLYFYFSYWLSKRDEIRRTRNNPVPTQGQDVVQNEETDI